MIKVEEKRVSWEEECKYKIEEKETLFELLFSMI
jgi:hypothetical protein